MNKNAFSISGPVCLSVWFCLFILTSCKKELYSPDQVSAQLIRDELIFTTLSENPLSQLITPNWDSAKQAVVNKSRIVRVPTSNVDNFHLLSVSGIELNILSNSDNQKGLQSSTPATKVTGRNKNYYEQHPPEVFFVQKEGSTVIETYLLNFVPADPTKEFGQDGVWTGKLYEWNLRGDTVYVQDIVKSKVRERYGIRKSPEGQQIAAAKGRASKLAQAIPNAQSGFFTWLATTLGDLVGWIGHFFGISEYSENFGNGNGGWRIRWNYGGGTDGGNQTTIDWIAGDGIYGSYLPGYGGSGYVYDPYPTYGPADPNNGNVVIPVSIAYLTVVLELTNSAEHIVWMDFLGSHPDISDNLANYLRVNTPTQENKEFTIWSIKYLMSSPNTSLGLLDNIYDVVRFQNTVPMDKEPTSYHWRPKLTSDDFSNHLTETTPLWISNNGTEVKNTEAFNCHYHAFGPEYAKATLAGYPKWITEMQLTSKNWSLVVGNVQVGDRVMYYANNSGSLVWTHSAIVTEVDADGYAVKVSSKMGTYQILEHHPRDIPESYGVTSPTFTIETSTYPSRIYWRKK